MCPRERTRLPDLGGDVAGRPYGVVERLAVLAWRRLNSSSRCPAAWYEIERLPLLAGDLSRIGAVASLELQVLADGVIEQSHAHAHDTSPASTRIAPRCEG